MRAEEGVISERGEDGERGADDRDIILYGKKVDVTGNSRFAMFAKGTC